MPETKCIKVILLHDTTLHGLGIACKLDQPAIVVSAMTFPPDNHHLLHLRNFKYLSETLKEILRVQGAQRCLMLISPGKGEGQQKEDSQQSSKGKSW